MVHVIGRTMDTGEGEQRKKNISFSFEGRSERLDGGCFSVDTSRATKGDGRDGLAAAEGVWRAVCSLWTG